MVNSQLSPRGATAMGCLFVVCGVIPILMGLGIITPDPSTGPPPPPWVPVACGLLFVIAGLAIIVDFGIAGGVSPEGDFKPGTSMVVRTASLLLALTIVGLFTTISGWVALGSGPGAFTSTLSIPFMAPANGQAAN